MESKQVLPVPDRVYSEVMTIKQYYTIVRGPELLPLLVLQVSMMARTFFLGVQGDLIPQKEMQPVYANPRRQSCDFMHLASGLKYLIYHK